MFIILEDCAVLHGGTEPITPGNRLINTNMIIKAVPAEDKSYTQIFLRDDTIYKVHLTLQTLLSKIQ